MKKSMLFLWSCVLVALFIGGCGGGGGSDADSGSSGDGASAASAPLKVESAAKAVVAYSIAGVTATVTGQQVQVVVPYGTDIRRVVPTFSTTGARVTVDGVPQVSGVTAQDLSVPVNYVVTADDGSTATYVVSVSVAPSQSKAITAFSIDGVTAAVLDGKLALTLPYGTDPRRLVATFTTSGAGVAVNGAAQVSGMSAQDFSQPVTYVVTAADGSTASYVATVSVALNQAKALTAFSIAGVNAAIDGPRVTATLPFGMNPAEQIASFSTTGASVTVDGAPQVSGRISRDFSRPVNYVVTAADGSSTSYTVIVSVAPSQAKAITAFSLGGVPGTISGNGISVTLPAGSDLSSQIASFTTTGTGVSVNGVTQASGSTPQNFDRPLPLPYVVHAADGSATTYDVTVSVAKSSAKAMTSFRLYGEPATFRELSPNHYRIDAVIYVKGGIVMPLVINNSPIYDQPTFTITGKSITLNGVPQLSGVSQIDIRPAFSPGSTTPLVYVVTAEDGSTATYTLSVSTIERITFD